MEKVKNSLKLDDDRKEEIKIPVPSLKHTYCGICCYNYTDYITHINSAEHTSNVKGNLLFEDIDEFIDQLNQENALKESFEKLTIDEKATSSRRILRLRDI